MDKTSFLRRAFTIILIVISHLNIQAQIPNKVKKELLIEPYIEYLNEKLKIKKKSYLNKKCLQEMLGNDFDQCKKYAKENNLSLKDAENVVEVLKFYDSLNKDN